MSLAPVTVATATPVRRAFSAAAPSIPAAPPRKFYLSRRDFLRFVTDMPKVELHTHIEGLVRPSTMMDIAKKEGLPLPAPDLKSLQHMIGMRKGENLLDFLKKFDAYRYVFDTQENLERIAYEAVQDNAKDHIAYTEFRMDPIKHPDKVSMGDTIDAICRGLQRGEKDFGVTARFIVSINRSYPVASAMDVAKAAVARKDNGMVVGLDLAGDEVHFPARLFTGVFQYAKQNGLHRTAHAGEAAGADSVREAVEDLSAERIGHGTRLQESPELEQELKADGVALDMCPTSNEELNVVKTLKNYPMVRYLHDGLVADLSTDDKAILRTNLHHEYMAMAENDGMSLGELQKIALNGIDVAFCDAATKASVRAQMTGKLAKMNAQLARLHPGATPDNTYVSPDDVDHWMDSVA